MSMSNDVTSEREGGPPKNHFSIQDSHQFSLGRFEQSRTFGFSNLGTESLRHIHAIMITRASSTCRARGVLTLRRPCGAVQLRLWRACVGLEHGCLTLATQTSSTHARGDDPAFLWYACTEQQHLTSFLALPTRASGQLQLFLSTHLRDEPAQARCRLRFHTILSDSPCYFSSC